MNKIQILKQHIKECAEVRKNQKTAHRKNQSNYDKIVTNGILKALESGELKRNYTFETNKNLESRHRGPLVKDLLSKYQEVKEKYEGKYHREYVTALHILYNELRGKKPHLASKECEDDFKKIHDFYRWATNYLEKAEELQESEERVEQEKSNAAS